MKYAYPPPRRPVPSIPTDGSTRLHPCRQKAYPLVLEAVRLPPPSLSLWLSLSASLLVSLPLASKRGEHRAFRFCEIFRIPLSRFRKRGGSCVASFAERRSADVSGNVRVRCIMASRLVSREVSINRMRFLIFEQRSIDSNVDKSLSLLE